MSTKTRKEEFYFFSLSATNGRALSPSTRANAHERASLSRSTTSATPRDEPAAVYEINKYALAREREGEIGLVG